MKDLFEKIEEFIYELNLEIDLGEEELDDIDDEDEKNELEEKIKGYRRYIGHLYDDWNENGDDYEY